MFWDGAVANKILIQYAPDAEIYEKERGLYVPIGKWGMPACLSMEKLCRLIENMDFDNVNCRLTNMVGNYETGKASEIVCKWIYDKCFDTELYKKEYSNFLC